MKKARREGRTIALWDETGHTFRIRLHATRRGRTLVVRRMSRRGEISNIVVTPDCMRSDRLVRRALRLPGGPLFAAPAIARWRAGPAARLAWLFRAHAMVLAPSDRRARHAAGVGDDGTKELIAGVVMRRAEQRMCFQSEHLVDVPQVKV